MSFSDSVTYVVIFSASILPNQKVQVQSNWTLYNFKLTVFWMRILLDPCYV